MGIGQRGSFVLNFLFVITYLFLIKLDQEINPGLAEKGLSLC